MARLSARTRKDSPCPLDKALVQVHRSAAGALWWFRTEMAACLAAAAGSWELDPVDRDYETLRIGTQMLFRHVSIETRPAAA